MSIRTVRYEMKNKNINVPHFTALAAALMVSLYPGLGFGAGSFNPAFLSDDVTSVTDLSRFEEGSGQAPGTYRVDLWRNNEFIAAQDMKFIPAVKDKKGGGESKSGLIPCMDVDLLKRLGVNFAAYPTLSKYKPGECISIIDEIPSSQVDFDFGKLRLNISFPQAAMVSSSAGYVPPEEWDEGIPALLMNYNFAGNRGAETDSYYLNLQSGLNLGAWRYRNNSAWNYNSSNGYRTNDVDNISNYVQRTIIPLKGLLELGDSRSRNEIFDSTSFRGARIYTSDNMYPDSLRGYAPTVRGIARTNAKVTARQGGFVIYQSFVTPGPFLIEDIVSRSSSGDIEVTVEENDGSQQKFIVPYSTIPLFLREGRFKYEVVTGNFRSGNKNQSDPYFTQATLIAGLPHGYTVYGGGQYSERYTAAVLGVGKNLGDFGALSVDLTDAHSKLADDSSNHGQSLRFLYAKSLNNYGTNVRLLGYRYSTRGFYTLDDVAYKNMKGFNFRGTTDGEPNQEQLLQSYYNLNNNKKQNFQVNITQSLGDYGSLYVSGNQQKYWGAEKADISYQLGYSSGWNGINYSLSLSWLDSVNNTTSDRITSLNVSVPVSVLMGRNYSNERVLDRAFATTTLSHDSDGNTSWRNGVSGTLLDDRSLNYSVSQGFGNVNSTGANLSWQGPYNNLGVGYSYNSNQHEYNWQASGGIVGHANGVTFSQPLGDTNVLIKAPGAAGVKVENQTGVKTDWRGYAVVPYATVYRYNRIALDTNSMDEKTDIIDNVNNVVPTDGALVRAAFDTHIGVRAIITVKQGEKVVPFGATVTEESTNVNSMVGEDGQVYLSGLPLKGNLLVKWGEGKNSQCSAPYSLSQDNLKQAVVVASATCL